MYYSSVQMPEVMVYICQCTDAIGHGVHVHCTVARGHDVQEMVRFLLACLPSGELCTSVQMSEVMVNNTVFVLKQWAFTAINH